MKKIYVVGDMTEYASFIKDSVLTENLKDADIVLFTGGEDVDPKFYDEKKHRTTFSNIIRDLAEQDIFNQIKSNQLALGICRGSQFLCIMNGGKLVQNCDNHALWGTHNIVGENGTFAITSTHHQMQFPYFMSDSEYEVLYKSEYNRSNFYDGSGINPDYIYEYGEPEIVRYTVKGKPVSLAIQGHPEYMDKNAPVVEMLNNLINETLNSLK